jgi:hypothetical protein
MLDISTYNSLVSSDINSIVYPENHIPTPQPSDYTNGFIVRYFAQRINTGQIYEVSSDNYNQISMLLFGLTSLNWYITGSLNVVKQNNIIMQPGVISLNKTSVNTANQAMEGLTQFLPNLSQFYKNV